MPAANVPLRTSPVILLVADLKGYTGLSAALGAGEVAAVLREWYARCRASLNAHGAILDKFIGDCVFAYWPTVTRHSKQAALDVARELRRGTRRAAPAAAATREVSLECCVGLHVGEVALGAMERGTNTALGDAVNVAFRIEALTRPLECGVLASASFLEDSGFEAHFVTRGSHHIKGHPQPIAVSSLSE
jgi:adenylate cyclase